MTMREVFIALKYIDIRTHNNRALDLIPHGVKIPFKHADPEARKAQETSPEEDALVEQALKNRRAEMKLAGRRV